MSETPLAAPVTAEPVPAPASGKPRWNVLAVAGFLAGVVGIIPIAWILAIIFGFLGLRRVRVTGERGKGLAVAALVLAVLWGGVFVAIGINGLPAGLTSSSRVTDLRVGQCVNGIDTDRAVARVPVVPCSEPHQGEVYAVVGLGGPSYPGDAEAARLAEEACTNSLAAYSSTAADDANLSIVLYAPPAASWLTYHDVVCVIAAIPAP